MRNLFCTKDAHCYPGQQGTTTLSMAQYVWNFNFQLSTSTPNPNPGSHMDLIPDLMHQVLYSRLVYVYVAIFEIRIFMEMEKMDEIYGILESHSSGGGGRAWFSSRRPQYH